MSDGGNVSVSDIDGGIVRLKLEGACGTCPSSTMTVRKSRVPDLISGTHTRKELSTKSSLYS